MNDKEFNDCLDELNSEFNEKDELYGKCLWNIIQYYEDFNHFYNIDNIKVKLDRENLDLYIYFEIKKIEVKDSNFERYLPTIKELIKFIGELKIK